MSENERKQEIAKAVTDIEYHPIVFEENFNIDSFTRIPLVEISALGMAFSPIITTATTVTQTISAAAEQLFLFDSRGHTGKLAKHKDGSGFLSTIIGNGSIGQGAFVPVDGKTVVSTTTESATPAMMHMAVVLVIINQKLDAIQEIQQEIIEFLQQKEKAKLRGNLNFLADVLNNYKYNWANEKYKNGNHIKVLDIRQESEQSILFYREQIEKKTKKQSFLHADKNVKDTLKTVASEFREYQLSLYLFSFSSFLEIMLLENFESAYLDAIVKKIEDYALQYRELYTQCYNQLEGYSKSSLESYFFSGLGTVNKVAGNAVAKIPVVSKSQLDETLIEAGNRMEQLNFKKAEELMKHLVHTQSGVVRPFIENINTVNRLYNQPMEILFDKENIYLALSEK